MVTENLNRNPFFVTEDLKSDPPSGAGELLEQQLGPYPFTGLFGLDPELKANKFTLGRRILVDATFRPVALQMVFTAEYRMVRRFQRHRLGDDVRQAALADLLPNYGLGLRGQRVRAGSA